MFLISTLILAPVISEIIGGPKFTLRALCPPQTPPSGKTLTNLQVLAYTHITVKFQRRSSINVRLTESSLYNGFRIERSPKMWFLGVILGVGAKIFGGKVHSSSEFRVFRHLWSRSDAPCSIALCMGIAICHRRKFGQVWGSPAPLPEVAGKRRCRKALLWTFDYQRKNRNQSAM